MPVATGVIFKPFTVHTPVVSLTSVTVSPLSEVAPEANAVLFGALAPGLLNVIT